MAIPNLEELLRLSERLDREDHPSPYLTAGVALELSRAYTLVNEALEPLKDILRDHVEDLLQEEGKKYGWEAVTGHIPSPEARHGFRDVGQVTVTFNPPKMRLNSYGRKMFAEGRLRRELGSYFQSLFHKDGKPVPEFRERVLEMPQPVMACAMLCVDLIEATPRVGFEPM